MPIINTVFINPFSQGGYILFEQNQIGTGALTFNSGGTQGKVALACGNNGSVFTGTLNLNLGTQLAAVTLDAGGVSSTKTFSLPNFANPSSTAILVSAVYAVDLTGQVAALSNQTLNTVSAAGATSQYRVTWSAKVTTPATTSCVLGGASGLQVTYTDADDSVVVTTPAWGGVGSAPASASTNTTQNQLSGAVVVNAKASTALKFAFGYTSVGTTPMAYSLHVRVEAV